MKTTKITIALSLFAAIATSTAFSAIHSPRYWDGRVSVIEGTGVKNPNLLAEYPKPSARTAAARPAAARGVTNPDTLAVAKNCPMAPRAKDTDSCKKMCAAAGIN